ncbi:FAD-binding oxidoreductase [Micromonospora sp. M71_S20]|uniref:NAD(P)/FAD-dependent oxidoreductase n=1 Tax=Micromonospora sp. M71_S20 TaxID=592872 RepID=UPI000EB41735|nr:FAD-dependent oxidoreductase [Micromonospora sp. M71_S20]
MEGPSHLVQVVVVGAGIVGAAVAYEAARAGAEVVLLDKSLPASGVTADSFAWIGGPREGDVPDPSTVLRRRVLQDYRRLEDEVQGLRVRWRGALMWGEQQLDDGRLAPGERLVDATEVGLLEPRLRVRPMRALHVESHGAIDPVAVTQALVRAAQEHGARLMANSVVTALDLRDRQVTGVRTSTGSLPADTVVVTAGVDAPTLCGQLGFDLPVAPSPALLMRFTAPPGLVRTLVATPHLEVREAADGHLLVAAGYSGEIDHDDLRRTGEMMLRRLTATFDAPDVKLVSVRLGTRPMPVDELPIIGPVPGVGGVYIAVMHSGVTLAPTAGRLIASEIVDGVEAGQLAGLRPARFPSRAEWRPQRRADA